MLFESLESRQLMSVTLNSSGTVIILGTDGNDVIDIRKRGAVVEVLDNGTLHRFDATRVKRVISSLGAGDDLFAAHGSIRTRMYVFGEEGNDNIRTGGGNDEIDGGWGDDRLNPGVGSDTVTGSLGDDVIDARGFVFNSGPDAIYHDPDGDFIYAKGEGRDVVRFNESEGEVHTDRKDVREIAPIVIIE